MAKAANAQPVKAAPAPANKRSLARLGAVQALYQMDVARIPLLQVVEEYEHLRLGQEIDGVKYRAADPAYFRFILSGVVKRQRVLDPLIHERLPRSWPLKRIDSLLRAILRAGAFELFERKDVPAKVIISEYVDVAKAYYAQEEPKLVNAVLDNLAREARGEDELAAKR